MINYNLNLSGTTSRARINHKKYRMVLADLGSQLQEALQRVSSAGVQDNVNAQFVDAVLEDIGKALIESDVSVIYVNDVKARIKTEVLDS